MGGTGPLLLIVVPPIKRYVGHERRPAIPMTYPSKIPAVTISTLPSVTFNV